MKNALYVQGEASKKYNPYFLKDFLIKAKDGTVIVDRARLLKTKDDERLFYVILNKDYKWDYSCSEFVTIYFEVVGRAVYGGVYNSDTGRQNKQIIAVEQGMIKDRGYNIYSYETKNLSEIITNIVNS